MSRPLTLAPVPVPSPTTPPSPTSSPTSSPGATNPPTMNINNPTTNTTTLTTAATDAPSVPSAAKRKASRRANTAERRATHNAVERQRRETLNGRFLDLAALLPNLATVRRPSKSAIVNSSIALIHSHRRARAAAGRELRALEEETQALRREVNEWRSRTTIPPLQSPQRTPEFMALLHAGEGDDEGAAAEEERRAYLLAGEGGIEEDDGDEWVPQPSHSAHQQHVASSMHPVMPMTHPGAPQSFGMHATMMEEKMAQWNALQYAMMQQQQQQQHPGHAMSVGPDPRMGHGGIVMQRSDHPQWSATTPPTLFARPVPSQHPHPHHTNSSNSSGPFAFSAPHGPSTFNTTGYLPSSNSSPGHMPSPLGGGGPFVGSPTGSTPPATTSSSFEDGPDSDGEGKWSMGAGATGAGIVSGPGGFAAMGMGMGM